MVGLGLAKTLGRLTATRAPLLAIPRVLSPSLARVPRFPAAPSQLDTTRSAAHTPRFPTTVPAAARSPLDSQLRVAALSKLGVSCAASAGGLVSAGVRRRAGDAELECAGQRRGFARPHGKSQRGQKKSAAAPVVESFAGLPVGVETVVFRSDLPRDPDRPHTSPRPLRPCPLLAAWIFLPGPGNSFGAALGGGSRWIEAMCCQVLLSRLTSIPVMSLRFLR